jgi:beta-lactamase class A
MTLCPRSSISMAARYATAAVTIALATGFAAPPAHAQDAHRQVLAAKLQSRLTAIASVDLTNGDRFGVHESLVFPQGSAIKVPILVELYRQAEAGLLTVDERIRIDRADAVAGSQLQHFRDGGSELSLHDLAVLMIIVSDNMATNLLIDRLGMNNVTRAMADLGLPETKLQRKMIRPEESARGNENLSTPQESATLMERIYRCDLGIGRSACRELRAVLEIPHAGAIQDAVPAGIVVGQKTGSITGVAVNWGYVDLPGRPYVLTAMGNYGATARFSAAIREATAAAHEYFSFLAGTTDHGTRVPLRLLPHR